MQLLVKGTRRIIFILCAVSDAKRYYSSAHEQPSQTRYVANFAQTRETVCS